MNSDLLIVSHSKRLRQHQHGYRDGHESKIVETDVHFARLVCSHSSFFIHVQENLHLLHIVQPTRQSGLVAIGPIVQLTEVGDKVLDSNRVQNILIEVANLV